MVDISLISHILLLFHSPKIYIKGNFQICISVPLDLTFITDYISFKLKDRINIGILFQIKMPELN